MSFSIHLRGRHGRVPASRLAASVALLFLVVLAATACGGDTSETGAATPAAAREGPATITVTSSAIAGQQGKMLLVSVASAAGGQIAGACIPITTDPFTVPATALSQVPEGSNPCSGGSPQATLAAGSYDVTAGVYAPPAQTPDRQVTTRVESTGAAPVAVTIDGGALSR